MPLQPTIENVNITLDVTKDAMQLLAKSKTTSVPVIAGNTKSSKSVYESEASYSE